MRDILFSYWGYGKFFIAILCLWLCFAQGACSYFYSLVSLLIFNLIHMQHQVWHVWARLWSGQSTDVVWPRRVPLSSLDRQRAVSATRGVALHHPISLVLSLAHWGRLRPSLQRQGQEHAQVDQRIQVSSPHLSLLSSLSLSLPLPPLSSIISPPCSKFDLYSKADDLPKPEDLMDYYQKLIDKYIPGVLNW